MADLSSYINIAANTANITGNAQASNFVGANIGAGNKVWQYSNVAIGASQITFPDGTSTIYNAGSVLTITGPSGAELVSGSNKITVDTAQGSNIVGALNVTGNVTAQGTGSNVTRRAFGLVAADTYVTLDDLKARVTSSTNQLSLILTTGSWQGTGWTETYTGGSASVQTWVNLPLGTGFDNASGSMNSQGNGCRAIISDQTPNAKVYQITVVRSGTTGALWNISIERLV